MIIEVYDDNGYIDTDKLSLKLKEANGRDVQLHIKTKGGNVYEAIAFYEALKNYSGKITTFII